MEFPLNQKWEKQVAISRILHGKMLSKNAKKMMWFYSQSVVQKIMAIMLIADLIRLWLPKSVKE